MSAVIESMPGNSRSARWFGPLLRQTVWPLLNAGRLSPTLLRYAFLSDYAGVFLPPPRGTRVHRVRFDGYRGELVNGPGVHGRTERAVLYFHGGGFIGCGLRTHRRMVARISGASQAQLLNVAYRQLPAARLSQSVEDCLAGYRLLLELGYPGDKVVFGGDSAGGYLAFAVALRAIAEGLPTPGGIIALSPWLDLECAHSLKHPNGPTDPYVPIARLAELAKLVADGRKSGGDPLESLLDTDLSALPPVLIQVGSVEVLRSDAELMAGRLADAGVPIRLQIWERQVHVFQAFADLVPEGRAALADLGGFIRETTAAADRQSAAS